MKNYILFLFLFLSMNVFAQPKNELGLGFLMVQNDELGKGFEQSYFRNFNSKQALGARVQLYGFLKDNESTGGPVNIFVDVVTRRTINKNQKVRLTTEFGLTALRRSLTGHGSQFVAFCGNSSPEEIDRIYQMNSKPHVTFFGLTTSLGVDFKVFNLFRVGANYNFKVYGTNRQGWDNEFNYLRNLMVKTSISF